MAEKEILLKNFDEYFEVAEYAYSKRKFNTAVTLYYKALVELCDLELLEKLNRLGANHTERFELLQTASPDLYASASKLFRFYRDSYNKEISESVAKSVREAVQNAKRAIITDKRS